MTLPVRILSITNILQLTSRALPRLDEDDRLTPILNHLSSRDRVAFSARSRVLREGPGLARSYNVEFVCSR